MRSFFSTNGSTHTATRFASGTTGGNKRKKMMLLVFFVVCIVSGTWTFRGSNSEGKNDASSTSSSYSRSQGKGKQTLLDSFEKEVHEHVLEPIVHGLFGSGSDDDTVSDEDDDDDDDSERGGEKEEEEDETVAADANADLKYREENEKAEMHDEEENQEADGYEVATMEKNAAIEREVRLEETARKASNMPKAFAIHRGNAKCANAPKEMLPRFYETDWVEEERE